MTKDGPATLDNFYFRPHAVRHLAASMMFDKGIQLEVAQEILGHSDKAVTQYYTHLTREAKRLATRSLEGFVQ
jgi:site-specific recombinase XerD